MGGMNELFGQALTDALDRELAGVSIDTEAGSRGNVSVRVVKYGATVPISCCLLSDSTGENHCTHAPYVSRIRWTRRLRWGVSLWWYSRRPHLHFGPCDEGEDW